MGVLKEDVIGSEAEYGYVGGKIVRTDRMLGSVVLGAGKPPHIFGRTGRQPAIAAGNMDVDIEMCEASTFALVINYDDSDREFQYAAGAERMMATPNERG